VARRRLGAPLPGDGVMVQLCTPSPSVNSAEIVERPAPAPPASRRRPDAPARDPAAAPLIARLDGIARVKTQHFARRRKGKKPASKIQVPALPTDGNEEPPRQRRHGQARRRQMADFRHRRRSNRRSRASAVAADRSTVPSPKFSIMSSGNLTLSCQSPSLNLAAIRMVHR